MSRWRPPRAKSSPYITPKGYRCLEQELKGLWTRRTEVTAALSAAAAEGDRSENAEYIYRKKELRGIDSRIRFLQKRMPELNVVNEVSDTSRIFFGARVGLEDESGQENSYRIVGADELDTEQDTISVDSPLAKLLLGKSVDEEVVLDTGKVTKTYYILSIEYSE